MELQKILVLEDGPRKTAALTAWIQGRTGPGDSPPILVGGAAVELLTGGAYTTGDLDFVGEISTALKRDLAAAGFVRRGRHWIHEAAEVFIEFPGSALDPAEEATWMELEGFRVRVISVEDLLVDRLGAWEYWRSSVDAVNALLLWRAHAARLDVGRLEGRAESSGWNRALDSVREFARRWERDEPPEDEVERWARAGP